MNIFVETDYRKIIQRLVHERKQRGEALTLGGLARAANMQKAHMTNVLKERASFQADQMFLVCRHLSLSADESTYLMLLLEQERSAVKERKQALAVELERLHKRHLQTESHLDPAKSAGESLDITFPDYYLDPIHQIVHIAISVDALSRNIETFARALGISTVRLNQVLSELQRHGLIEKKRDRYVNVRRHLHLKKSSPIYRAWRQMLGSMALSSPTESREEHFGFTAVFSADEATRKKMHGKILEVIKSFEKDVESAPARGVYQLSIDLLPWVKPPP